jgi:hypothetical protein
LASFVFLFLMDVIILIFVFVNRFELCSFSFLMNIVVLRLIFATVLNFFRFSFFWCILSLWFFSLSKIFGFFCFLWLNLSFSCLHFQPFWFRSFFGYIMSL